MNGLRFSATQSPPAPHLQCELPFGFVWTPMCEESSQETSQALVCLQCLGHYNLYCDSNAGRWTCNLCGFDKNVLTRGTPELSSPVVIQKQTVEAPDTATHLILVVDSNLSIPDIYAIGHWLLTLTQLRETINVGLVVFGKYVSLFPVGEKTTLSSAHIVSEVTEMEDAPFLRPLKSEDDWLVVWKCLAGQFGFDPNNMVVPKNTASRLEMLKQRKKSREVNGVAPDTDGAPTGSLTKLRCTGEAVLCAIEMASMSPPSARSARIFVFTNGCINHGIGSGDPQEAMKLIAKMATPAAKAGIGIDVLCTGSLTLEMPVLQALTEPSAGYAISMISYQETLTANLNHLWHNCRMSGVFSQEEGGEDGCVLDIKLNGVEATHLVGPGDFEGNDSLVPSEQRAFEACEKLAQAASIKTAHLPDENFVDSMTTRIQLLRHDALATYSVMLKVMEELTPNDFVVVQGIVRYMSDATTLVTKVCTHRLNLSGDVSTFLDCVDEHVVPVMLGKEAVYRSMYGREADEETEKLATEGLRLDQLAYEAQRDIDTTIHRISAAFRLLGLEEGSRAVDLTENGERRHSGTSLDLSFPPELSDALKRLYHFRRGPLVSPGPLQSADNKAELRSLFTRLPLDACLSMMAPSVWSTGKMGMFGGTNKDIVPPENLILWSDSVLAADHYTTLFVWSGQSLAERQRESLTNDMQKFLKDRTKGRFPMPSLQTLSEGESMSRRFTALLAPSHCDPHENQLIQFPALEKLNGEELDKLRSKFGFHDEAVDPSFRQWFWEVSSASSSVNTEGVSLCE